jgi:DNA polymerase-3 subunit gamma/tau
MAASSYQSLYRRYRPQRFDEVRGQDHVTRALRNAVRDGRIGHAYLFSGPRGTGKTSTARILAKVLNCANPQDGEPDGVCDNCVAVQRGQVVDWLLEQDAASKSKVDDMRDLLDRVPLGTSGNRKVIILDEVHMLSQGAENALLKTLEEPPAHVVFVLATTDPQKVRPTIRSRTQHFEFHLLPSEVVTEHVRYVIEDAGLGLNEDAVAHVVRVGGGSARDTLSALDQVAALGEVLTDTQPVDAILDALVARDAGMVLVAVADAMATGRDPRALGEALIARLRDAFLALMGAAETHLPEFERARAAELGEQLGPAGLTRALEVLGEALMELSRKPDPRVVVEVALIRLVRPEADRSIDAVLARLERLEQGGTAGTPAVSTPASVGPDGGEAPVTTPAKPTAKPTAKPRAEPKAPAPAPAQPPAEPGDGPASAARAVLAASRPGPKSKAGTPAKPAAPAPPADPPQAKAPEPAPAPAPAPAPEAPPAPPQTASPTEGGLIDVETLAKTWSARLLGELPVSIRSKWRAGRWIDGTEPGVARFVIDNKWHQQACEEGRAEVEKLLTTELGQRVRIELVVDGPPATSVGAAAATRGPEPPDAGPEEIGDVAELADANDVATSGVDLLLREFGGELVEEDPK